MTGPTAPATSISQAARSARGTAVAAIISWAGTDDRGDLPAMKPIPPPAARGRSAADATAVAGFFWCVSRRALEHLRTSHASKRHKRNKAEHHNHLKHGPCSS